MAQKISSLVLGLISKLGEQTCFIICSALIIVIGVTQVAVTLVKGEYKRIDFIRHFLLSFSVLSFEFLHSVILKGLIEYLLVNCCICLFFFTITFCLPVRGKKLKKEERELALFLDKQFRIQNQTCKVNEQEKAFNQIQEAPIILKTEPPKQTSLNVPIDYSHVKNVIERLNYFPLSVNDRRQVRDLEGFLIEAESGEENQLLKSKINDGLGALLKIMSKYGA